MGLKVEQEVHGNAIVRGFFLSYVGFGQGQVVRAFYLQRGRQCVVSAEYTC